VHQLDIKVLYTNS